MKAQVQLYCYDDSGEQLAVCSGPTVHASSGTTDLAKAVGQWIAGYCGGKWVRLAQDLAQDVVFWLGLLGGDVKAKGQESETFDLGGSLPDGSGRRASYAIVYLHAWTGDDIKPSRAGVEPPNSPAITNLGESRYTRSDFQYEYPYLIRFSLLGSGKYAFAFAAGDSGWWADAAIGYMVGLQVDPAIVPLLSIQQKYDQLTQNNWCQLGSPLIDETTAPDGIGRYRHCQNGSLYWSPDRGAQLLHGRIRDKWAQTGWERVRLPADRRADAHEVHGAICERWPSSSGNAATSATPPATRSVSAAAPITAIRTSRASRSCGRRRAGRWTTTRNSAGEQALTPADKGNGSPLQELLGKVVWGRGHHGSLSAAPLENLDASSRS